MTIQEPENKIWTHAICCYLQHKTHLAWNGRDDTQITKIHGDSLVSFGPHWVVSPRKSSVFSMQETSPNKTNPNHALYFPAKAWSYKIQMLKMLMYHLFLFTPHRRTIMKQICIYIYIYVAIYMNLVFFFSTFHLVIFQLKSVTSTDVTWP